MTTKPHGILLYDATVTSRRNMQCVANFSNIIILVNVGKMDRYALVVCKCMYACAICKDLHVFNCHISIWNKFVFSVNLLGKRR